MRRGTGLLFCLVGALGALTRTTATADNIRGTVKAAVQLTLDDTISQATEILHQEFVLISLPADVTYLDGVQIELTLAGEARARYDEFAIAVYGRLDTIPTPGFRSLTGTQVFLHPLAPLSRLFFLAGLSDGLRAQGDPAQGIARLPDTLRAGDYPILAGVIAIGKTVPEPAQGIVFYLTCKPILRDAGALVLRIRPPVGEHPYDVHLDGASLGGARRTGAWETTQELRAGLHTVRVSSPTLRTAESTFTVERAGTRVVEMELVESAATLAIEGPRGAAVYLDGRKLDLAMENSLNLLPGEHAIRYTLGDYSITRSFTVAEGKSYTVYLEMVIGVKED